MGKLDLLPKVAEKLLRNLPNIRTRAERQAFPRFIREDLTPETAEGRRIGGVFFIQTRCLKSWCAVGYTRHTAWRCSVGRVCSICKCSVSGLERCKFVPERAMQCPLQHALVRTRGAGWTCRCVATEGHGDVVQLEGEGGVVSG